MNTGMDIGPSPLHTAIVGEKAIGEAQGVVITGYLEIGDDEPGFL